MKKIHLLIAFAVLIILFSGCKKDTTNVASGSITLLNGSNGDSTVYNITNGELNVNASGSYTTTAVSGNSVLNIVVTGQIPSGTNYIGSGNNLLMVFSTNNGGTPASYDNVQGALILSGTTLNINVAGVNPLTPNVEYALYGTVKY